MIMARESEIKGLETDLAMKQKERRAIDVELSSLTNDIQQIQRDLRQAEMTSSYL
jgi:septal ring factor EnvC (AmiA/AmiB activator)